MFQMAKRRKAPSILGLVRQGAHHISHEAPKAVRHAQSAPSIPQLVQHGVQHVSREAPKAVAHAKAQDRRNEGNEGRGRFRRPNLIELLGNVAAKRTEPLIMNFQAHAKDPLSIAARMGAEAAYAGYVNNLWDRAKKYYPTAGKKMPGFGFENAPPGEGGLLGLTYQGKGPGRRPVVFTPEDALTYMRPITDPRNIGPPFVRSMPIHEWAHEYQTSPWTDKTVPLTEGSAEAFNQDVAPRLGLIAITNPTYARYVADLKRKKGPGFKSWIRRGQFG